MNIFIAWQAAALDHAPAQYNLGVLYMEGRLVKKGLLIYDCNL